MTKTMKHKTCSTLVAVAILAGSLSAPSASAGVRVYVRVAPPAAIVETVPVAPSPRHIWVPGYHRWDGRAYVWFPGRYVLPPRANVVWVPGHWASHRRGWYWIEGHWRHR